MYGRVDRGGSREGKKSLRKNKIAIADKIKNSEKQQAAVERPSKSPLAPSLANKSSDAGIIDCGCNFVSRRFENDLSRVIQRALTGGVDGMIIVSNDFDKQDVVSLLVKQYSGSLYACVGIHPDNVKRANDKLFQQRQEALKDIAVMPETVAVVCGLDWTREFATRYPQEKLLINHFELAAEVDLPVVVCTIGDGAAEKLAEKLNDPTLPKVSGVAVYNFMGTAAELDMLLAVTSVPVYIMISGVICDASNAKGQEIRGLVSKIPRDRLLLCSDSPKFTPQNIDDPYIRDQKNEPSNMPWVVKEIAAALDVPVAEIGAAMRANGKTFFKLHDKGEGPAAAAPAAAAVSESSAQHDDDSDDDNNGIYDDFDSDDYADAPKSDIVIPANPGKPLEIGPRTPAPLQTPSAIIASREESESASGKASTSSTASGAKPQGAGAATASKEARYACILCRNVLAVSKDIIPHDQGLDQLKDLKRAKNDVEFDSANVMFVHEVQWMKEMSTYERKESSVPLAEGKLDCPKCGSKHIGKWHLPSGSDQPIYTLKKKRVDLLVEGDDTKSRMQEDELDSDDSDDDGRPGKKNKKRKKVVKQGNLSNMGNFRNKGYNAAKTTAGKKKGRKGDEDDE
eukprot:TRINITY_DN668_c0_g3_i1.p1 TRINITY_DN668_c0_g3~~TRINITY_DN668_c0_g3_i1.p1  ORF type:complete len:625 (-),score=190.73 TRINITY_DN668_c0_g3_i1:16-1890(-)